MEHRSPAVYLIAAAMVVLVVGLVLVVLPGPGLLIAGVGAAGVLVGLAMLMVEHRPDPPTGPTGGSGGSGAGR